MIKFLLLFIFTITFFVNCSTHLVAVREQEKVRTEVVSQDFQLELLSEPTPEDPVAKFNSFKEIKLEETYQKISIFKREPSWMTIYGLLGTSLGLSLLASDMNKRGYSNHATPVWIAAFLTFIPVVPKLIKIGDGNIYTLFNWRKIEQSEELRTIREPCPVDVMVGTTKLRSRITRFDLSEHLNLLPKGQDLKFTIAVSDSPQISSSFTIKRDVVPEFYRQKEIRIQKEKEEQESREMARRLELERASRPVSFDDNQFNLKDVPLGYAESKIIEVEKLKKIKRLSRKIFGQHILI